MPDTNGRLRFATEALSTLAKRIINLEAAMGRPPGQMPTILNLYERGGDAMLDEDDRLRLSLLEDALGALTDRLAKLEKHLTGKSAPPSAPEPPPTAAPADKPDRSVSAPPAIMPPAETPGDQDNRHHNLEERIGRTWLNRLGVLFVSVAVILFLRLTYDKIGDAAKAGLGFLAGSALLGSGLWAERRGYRSTAVGLVAAGSVALYLSAFASYAMFHLLARLPALGLMALITAITLLLALKMVQPFVAFTGLAGGFLAPALLRFQGGDPEFLFSILGYLAVLDLCLLWLSHFRRWPELVILSFLATQGYLVAGWTGLAALPGATALTAVGVFFAIFAALGVYQHLVRRQPSEWHDVGLAFLNGLAVLVWMLVILGANDWATWTGLSVLGLAGLHFLLGLVLLARNKANKPLLFTYFGLAVALATLAIPLQMKGSALTLGWLAESVVLVWLGWRLKNSPVRCAGTVAYLLALFPTAYETGILLTKPSGKWLPPGLWSMIGAACAAHLLALVYRRIKSSNDSWLGQAYFLLGSLLAAGAVSIQWWLIGRSWIPASTSWVQCGFFLIWAGEAIILMLRSRTDDVFFGGVGMLVWLGLGMKTLIDGAYHYSQPSQVWFDGYLLQGLGLIALTVAVGLLWPHNDPVWRHRIGSAFGLVAVCGLWLLLTLEVLTWPSRLLPTAARGFVLSAVWSLYAATAISLGLRLRWRAQRLLGLGFLGIALIRVFLDLWRLRGLYRVCSFFGLGLVLIAISFLYQRWGAVFFGRDKSTKAAQ